MVEKDFFCCLEASTSPQPILQGGCGNRDKLSGVTSPATAELGRPMQNVQLTPHEILFSWKSKENMSVLQASRNNGTKHDVESKRGSEDPSKMEHSKNRDLRRPVPADMVLSPVRAARNET